MSGKTRQKSKMGLLEKALLVVFIVFVLWECSGGETKEKKPEQKQQEKKTENTVKPSSQTPSSGSTAVKPRNSKDPYGLSFSSSSLYFDSDLRGILSSSELEYCSFVIQEEGSSDMTLTWNLASNNKTVYSCDYSFDKKREYRNQSVVACEVGEAYQEFKDGDRKLIRDYVMPQKDDGIDMFIYPERSSYYEKYFILGKYSDMSCYIKGDDLYLEYFWYQNTEDGPALVYQSTAVNYTTTSGKRYREDLWELFEESYKNIDIIPYKDYPREKDYYDVYREWKNSEFIKNEKEDLKENIEIYCQCDDGEHLYSEYEEDFDSWEAALDFYEEYCE